MSVRARLAPAARQGIKGAAALADVVRTPSPGITILIYHRVGAGTGGQMDLSPDAFDRQLEWLSAHRRVLSLDQAADELAGPSSAQAPDGVVVTFDDGTPDWVEHVLPALERHHVPATFYVATSFVEHGTELPGGGRPVTWQGLAELASSPWATIGSHTHGHLLLDRLPAGEVADELDRSIELLGAHLDDPVTHFAYPKAVAGSAAAEQAVRERFRTAVLAGTRANRPGVDLHRLQRSPIQAADGQRWFRRKAGGGMHAEDDLRDRLNRVRYRGRTT